MNKEEEEEIIEKLAPSLSKFGKVRDGVYQFRCIYCGDSRKNPNKRRGYLYLKGNSYNYCCHNCNHRGSLKGVLRDLGSELLKENPKQTQTLRSSTKPSTISRKESFTVK